MLKLIGISGKKNSGKTLAAIILKCFLNGFNLEETNTVVNVYLEGKENFKNIEEYIPEWEIRGFAEDVKNIASVLTGLDAEKFEDRAVKNAYYETWGMTGRELLQKIGGGFRKTIDEDVWIKSLFQKYDENKRWIISDVRYPNEAEYIKSHGGVVFKLLRNINSTDTHSSETSVENVLADFVIDNRNYSVNYQIMKLHKILKNIKD